MPQIISIGDVKTNEYAFEIIENTNPVQTITYFSNLNPIHTDVVTIAEANF